MLLIAEIGVNHNGQVGIAELLIRKAAASGATAVKFQHFSAETLTTRHAPKVAYQLLAGDKNESHYEMLKKLEITDEIETLAVELCQELEIEFISTPYDKQSAKRLVELGCNYIKTASADIVDLPLHKAIAEHNVKPLVATGMATFEEIDEVVQIYKQRNREITLLHCVSNYPCSKESLNLRVIPELQKRYGVQVGFSDHSVDEKAAVVAYALGCRVFEKHFTFDKNADGPDHKASSTPDEFLQLSTALKETECILGSDHKSLQPEEVEMHKVSRKSLHAARPIKFGDVFTEKHIKMIRPGGGLAGADYYKVIGKKATRDLIVDEQILESDFE